MEKCRHDCGTTTTANEKGNPFILTLFSFLVVALLPANILNVLGYWLLMVTDVEWVQ